MKNISFSVVIPLYNKEKYIKRTLASVLNQTHQNFEIVVVDDGSTDNSIKVVKSVEDKRIRYVKQVNKGVSAARNKGINLAQNNFVALLDADDEWNEFYLEEMAKSINSCSDCIAYATNYRINNKGIIREPKLKGVPIKSGIVKNYYLSCLRGAPIISSSSVCINKKLVIEELDELFPVGVKRGEDLDFWTRLNLKNNVYFSNRRLVTIHREEGSATDQPFSISEPFNYQLWYSYKPIGIKEKLSLWLYTTFRIFRVYVKVLGLNKIGK